MKAWHFVSATLRDGNPIPPDGVKLVYHKKPIICQQGFHASLHPFDALGYAPGNTLCLVECGGVVFHQPDKLVCTERTILARMDSTPLLKYFAKQQALSVVHLWNPPQIVLDYLMGDEAARTAAWYAARTAARDAAWSAARDAARTAAWYAARDAAWYAARDAARAAARAVARADFTTLVNEAFVDWI